MIIDGKKEAANLREEIKNEILEIKKNYQINGTVKKAKFNIFNQVKIDNLNLSFNISNNQLTLKKIETNLNSIKLKSHI